MAERQRAQQQVLHRVGAQFGGGRRIDADGLEGRGDRPGPAVDLSVDRGVVQAEVDHHLLCDEPVNPVVVGDVVEHLGEDRLEVLGVK